MLRANKYVNLQGVVSLSDDAMNIASRRIILLSTYLESPRFMTEIYYNAMRICKTYGFPDVCVTFTYLPKWLEITRFVQPRCLSSEDRPDILSQVFKIKIDCLIKDLKTENWFGKVIAC